MKRREFLTISMKSLMAAGLTSSIPYALLRSTTAHAELLAAGLSDPAIQPLFTNLAPNAMSAAFKYGVGTRTNKISIKMEMVRQFTGLLGLRSNGSMGTVSTPVWGYGADDDIGSTWPGRTFNGGVTYIATEAEFTPKNVQTAEERVRLVYAVKVRIDDDPKMDLKPGMPVDVQLDLHEAPRETKG